MAAVDGGAGPRVAVVLTGGTIGSAGRDELDRLDYVDTGRVLADEEALPLYRFPDGVDVVTHRFSRILSGDVTADFWLALRLAVLGLIADDPGLSGVVVAHGTATLEETAYFLHLTLPTETPVVLVGAQRPPTAMSSDARLSLYNAVVLAASPDARGHGVLIAMDDRILSARDALKSSNHGLDTFQPRSHGALGDIDAYGRVWFYRRGLRRHTVSSRFATALDDVALPLPRVEIVAVYAGADGAMMDAAVAAGARGVVTTSLPPSLNPTPFEEAVARATAAGVVVVQSTRAVTGRTTSRPSFAGRRVVGADTLTPQAARLLLTLCLATGLSYDETVAAFEEH
jgi:L-asparaginase